MSSSQMLIAVAPNGARRSKKDHPALPLSPRELADTALACAEAGAGMLHLHVRNEDGRHSLEPKHYQPVIREVQAAVGEEMLIQLTSEAAGVYTANQQIELMERLAPHCFSCGLREIVKDHQEFTRGQRFFAKMHSAGTRIQYILYSPEDVHWYEQLCDQGVLPGNNHLLLFVFGRYGCEEVNAADLSGYLEPLRRKSQWMVCAFGQNEHNLVRQAAELGGHGRVGFENNLLLPDGRLAINNKEIVDITVKMVKLAGRIPGDKSFASALFGR